MRSVLVAVVIALFAVLVIPSSTSMGYGSIPSSLLGSALAEATSVGSGCRLAVSAGPTENMASAELRVFREDTGRRVGVCYTDPLEIGYLKLGLPPGRYSLLVGWAPGFFSRWVRVELELKPRELVRLNVTVPVLVKPWRLGWYSADLHYHSDYADGRTPLPYVAVAQSAMGLDVVTVTDHDYVGNCGRVERYAKLRNKTFACGIEISPPWGHFNAFPILHPEKPVLRGTMREIIGGARRAGALVVIANHPYIERTGIFWSLENGAIPGGYYEGWDLAEINREWSPDDERTPAKMMEFWSAGMRKYLAAGSDVHDAWATPHSGYPRVFAYVSEGPELGNFASALLAGRSFVSYGPLIFTEPLLGSPVVVMNLSLTLTFKVRAYSVEGPADSKFGVSVG